MDGDVPQAGGLALLSGEGIVEVGIVFEGRFALALQRIGPEMKDLFFREFCLYLTCVLVILVPILWSRRDGSSGGTTRPCSELNAADAVTAVGATRTIQAGPPAAAVPDARKDRITLRKNPQEYAERDPPPFHLNREARPPSSRR